ncbi:prolyl oligopeptidase family serine peptidase [Telluria beijingensis]|uniref:prolyl oligopeptidase family serine peptidase n=1 Tax=Telluria beijingensis TaxID=3068633 RepID=UPI0027962DFE|nr:prolyl oligopeptidase family serine peptidase [Massilia sp. REN29]
MTSHTHIIRRCALALAASLTLAGNAGAQADRLQQLEWLEAPNDPKALAWAREQTDLTTAEFSKRPTYRPVMDELRTALKASAPLADILLLGPRAMRLQKDAAHPHGQLQVAARRADGSLGDWKTVLSVDALRSKEGKPYDLQLAGFGNFARNCLAPAYRYCLLSLAPEGGDEVELREFDLEAGNFVAGGLRVPQARTQFAWLDKDRVLIAHTLGDSPRTSAGWGAAVRLWRRGADVGKAPVVYQAEPGDALVTLDRLGEGAAARGVIQRVIDYSTFELFLLDAKDKPVLLPLPRKLGNMGLQGVTRRHLLVQPTEAAEIDGRRYPADALLSYDTAAATPQAERIATVYQPAEGEVVEGPLTGGIAAAREDVGFVIKRGLGSTIRIASPVGEGWRLREAFSAPAGINVRLEAGDIAGGDMVMRTGGFLAPAELRLLRNGTPAGSLGAEAAAFDASGMLVETRQARSKDGTMIDYYLVRPRTIAPGQSTPTLMTGYGAFGISMAPGYLDFAVGGKGTKLWFERGGALVLPAIRGGGERGAAWHRAAMRELRQNSYDDFIAVAEDLVQRGFVKPAQLGVFGLSNGGLLSATIGLQRPDLFGAVVSDVPLIDMLRFPHMGMGGAWTNEYGDPTDPAMARVLATYSPLHIAKDGVRYPPFLVTVATSDNRVGPGHARKMVARLKQIGSPAWLYEDADGGHGVSDPLTRPELMGLRMTFLIETLMKPAP